MRTTHYTAKILTTLLFIMVAMCHSQAIAQPTDIQEQLDALQQRLDEVQTDTAGMRNELDALKVEEQDWLTQERAIEI